MHNSAYLSCINKEVLSYLLRPDVGVHRPIPYTQKLEGFGTKLYYQTRSVHEDKQDIHESARLRHWYLSIVPGLS